MNRSQIDLLEASYLVRLDATHLQNLLQAGKLTSVQLVLSALEQIKCQEDENLKLNAMLAVTSKEQLLERAEQLDRERQAGQIRSPLHGIPIILKDCIATHPALGLPTSVGSFALLSSKPSKNASVVDQLIEAGLIILGKTNLTEFCNIKSETPCSGWSPVGGQTQSAYVMHSGHFYHTWADPASPAGSSTGSAVGVSAGYAPLTIGSETEGSIIQPASRAGLYALKPTIGKIASDGTWKISSTCDSLGPMAKSVEDLVSLYKILSQNNSGLEDALVIPKHHTELRVGFLDPALWQWPESPASSITSIRQQVQRDFINAIEMMKPYIKEMVPVAIPQPEELMIEGEMAKETVFYYEYGENINQYLASLESAEVRTLQELTDWNIQHATLELPERFPDQNRLLRALHAVPSQKTYERAKSHMQSLYRENGIDRVVEAEGVDLIVAPSPSKICTVVTASGYPIATMPLSTLDYNGMPFGIVAIATAHHEPRLFEFMRIFEQVFPNRPIPLQWDS